MTSTITEKVRLIPIGPRNRPSGFYTKQRLWRQRRVLQGDLAYLFAQDNIQLQDAATLRAWLPALPHMHSFDRYAGLMLGLAIGDALSYRNDLWCPVERRQCYGEVRDYLPHWRSQGQSVGTPSSETQLPFRCLHQLLLDGGFDVQRQAQNLASGRRCNKAGKRRRFAQNYYEEGKPWHACASTFNPQSGVLTRVPALLVTYLRSPAATLWAETAVCARLMNRASAVLSSCVALNQLLWFLMQQQQAPAPTWWLDEVVACLRALETEDQLTLQRGYLWSFLQTHLSQAYEADLNVAEACLGWGSGEHLFETVPSVLYIMMRHAHEGFERVVLTAINETRANGRIAALCGALAGALYGVAAIPERWRRNLPGDVDRTTPNLYELLEAAQQAFGPPAAPALPRPDQASSPINRRAQ